MGEAERQAAIENPGMFDHDLDICRQFYERGNYHYVVHAVDLCLQFGLAMPDWLEGEVAAAMRFYRDNGGAAKQGSKGHVAKTLGARRDAMRYEYVERERAKGKKLDEALDIAMDALRGTIGFGSRDVIRVSYKRLDHRYRTTPRKPGRRKSGAKPAGTLATE